MNKKILFLLFLINKIILILLFFVLVAFFSVHFNIFGFKDQIYQKYPNLELRKKLFSKKSVMEKIYNDYNVMFLPNTQFIRLDLKKIKLNFLPENKNSWFKTFYIEAIKDKIWIIDMQGNFFEIKIDDVKNINNKKNLEAKTITSNLNTKKVLDSFIHNKNIYISYVTEKNNCKTLQISFAKMSVDYLDFKNFFTSEECGEHDMYGGKMQFFEHKEVEGLLLTAVDVPPHLVGNVNDKPQNDKSIFGKILFIDFEKKNHIVFSRGHRNPSGLYSENNLILSTEHGPWSGDEINKIIFNKNYGWPISSYGERYGEELYPLSTYGEKFSEKGNLTPTYHKNHYSLDFEEPIFSFVPALGISEIIKLPNNFSNFWIDNFIISSLWGQSLHRIKFDENYNKVILNEKIFIGGRIRDLEYHNKMNAILLSLEQTGELGIITKE